MNYAFIHTLISSGTNNVFLTVQRSLSEKKRYKSCHWGCTFSKGTLL